MGHARILFGCYRASDANDPEVYLTATIATLCRYPEAIARAVCDPTGGLPSANKWLPSIAEIKEACEERLRPVYDQQRRDEVRLSTLNGPGSRKAPVGSPEHKRVMEGFRNLRAELSD